MQSRELGLDRAFEFVSRTADGAMAIDRHQRVVLWNGAARRILGLPAHAVLGRRCWEVLRGTDGDGCAVCRRGCLAVRMALGGHLVPTRDLQVPSVARGPTRINVTTLVLPSRWHDLSLLVHLFRERGVGRATDGDRAHLAGPPGRSCSAPGAPRRWRLTRAEVLTPRESEVLALLACASSTRQIARDLSISPVTVRTHVQRILAKLGVHSRLEAVTLGLRHGWVPGREGPS